MNECYGCRCLTTKMNRLMCIVIYLFATSSFAYVATASGELTTSPENNNMMSVHPVGRQERDSPTGRPTTVGEYVATTPKIDISSKKAPSRYEQGLEDYEEAVARVEQTKENQRGNNLMNTLSMLSVLNDAWQKVTANRQPSVSGRAMASDDSTIHTEADTPSADVSEGRYIKGDPLKGYYDFIITEGSYKFWAVFQLATALLMIYSTFAAIYYSKVNPIVSDYDYVNYLGGRSLADDPEPEAGPHPAASLLNSGWMQTAAHSFEFVLNAIDRLPAQS